MVQSVGMLKSRRCSIWRPPATTGRRRSGSTSRATRATRTGRASTCWRTTSGRTPASARRSTSPPSGNIDDRSCASGTSAARRSCSRAVAISVPGAGMLLFRLRQASIGSPPFSRPATLRNSSCVAASSRIAIASSRSTGSVNALLQPQLLLEAIVAEAERCPCARGRRSFSR